MAIQLQHKVEPYEDLNWLSTMIILQKHDLCPMFTSAFVLMVKVYVMLLAVDHSTQPMTRLCSGIVVKVI